MIKLYAFVFSCFVFNALHAQPLFNGNWRGSYAKQFPLEPKIDLLVDISIEQDSIVTGSSHLYYPNGRYEHYRINGKLNPKDSSVHFTETIINSNIPKESRYAVEYKMSLADAGDQWKLEGRWKAAEKSLFGYAFFNKVWLFKRKEEKEKVEVKVEDKHKMENKTDRETKAEGKREAGVGADSALRRLSDLQSIVEIPAREKDSIYIDLYDNGDIDNDSVTVYFDDHILVSHAGLTAAPTRLTVSLGGQERIHKIKLIADNLGSIPPNTALMIIRTKTRRHEVRLSSDMNRNAVVELFVTE